MAKYKRLTLIDKSLYQENEKYYSIKVGSYQTDIRLIPKKNFKKTKKIILNHPKAKGAYKKRPPNLYDALWNFEQAEYEPWESIELKNIELISQGGWQLKEL